MISKERTAIIHELRGEAPPSLEAVLARLQPCDLVIVEGCGATATTRSVRNLALDIKRWRKTTHRGGHCRNRTGGRRSCTCFWPG
ncbi:MAG: molybdopterin-guanine dinucleotide biosynthesis protein MobB [Hyphomicrobiales bacterium]